jgi:hypothetical protein
MAMLLYGCALRFRECLWVPVKNLDLADNDMLLHREANTRMSY